MLGAVILGAGLSSRMAGQNKLIKSLHDRPLLLWSVEAAIASCTDKIVLVASADSAKIVTDLERGGRLSIVLNPEPEAGLSHSLKLGLSSLSDCAAIVVLLGDMPYVDAALIDEVLKAWTDHHYACAPGFAGEMGHPIVLSREAVLDCMTLAGDRGAKMLLECNGARVLKVPIKNPAIHRDFDRQEDFSAFEQRRRHIKSSVFG